MLELWIKSNTKIAYEFLSDDFKAEYFALCNST
jgi:hypothetical protein